jgi:hypothetical protein
MMNFINGFQFGKLLYQRFYPTALNPNYLFVLFQFYFEFLIRYTFIEGLHAIINFSKDAVAIQTKLVYQTDSGSRNAHQYDWIHLGNTMAFVADKDFKIRKDISDLRHKLDPPIGVGRHASYGTSPVNKPSAPTNF